MKQGIFWSDYTPKGSGGNMITFVQRDDGDIEMKTNLRHPSEKNVVVAMSGSRHVRNSEIIKKFSEIIDLLNEENKNGAK